MTTEVVRPAPEGLPEELAPRHVARRVLSLALLGVAIVVLITALPGLDEVRARFANADGLWLAVAAVLELASCLAYVVAFRGVFCRRLGWRFSYQIGMAEQGMNAVLPVGGVGGLALGVWALRQGGMDAARIARRSVAFFVLTSTPNFLCTALAGTAILAGAPSGSGPAAVTLAFAVGAWLAIIFVAMLPWIIARLAGDAPASDSRPAGKRVRHALKRGTRTAGEGVQDAITLVRTHQPFVVPGAIGYMGFDVAALAAAFAAFGAVPSLAAFVFAYAIGQLGALIPLPGGIGGTEGGLIGALTLYGSSLSQATAAVLAYRAFQLGIPAILGFVAFIQLRRTLARDEAPAALCEPIDADALPVMTLPQSVAAGS